MSERQIPSTIDYSQVLPLSVPAIAKRQKFYAANGGVFSAAANNEIRIPVHSVNSLCDPAHSYLEFAVRNVGGQTFGPDIGGAYNFFTECRIEQGGRVLSRIQELNRLYAAVITPCQDSSEGVSTEGIFGSRRTYTQGGAGAASLVVAAPGLTLDIYSLGRHNNQNYFANASQHRFAMPIPTGLFNQDKLLPLPLVDNNSPITIVLTLGIAANVGCWNGLPGANDLEVFELSYNAQLVEVGNDVIEQFRGVQDMFGGQLVLSGQDWEYSAANIVANQQGTVDLRIPVRKRSIKSFFWIAQSDDYANTGGLGPSTTYNLGFSGQANIESWNLKFGSVVFPSTPVRAMGNSGVADAPFRRGESVMELAKAFGTLGFENPTGTLSTTSYCTDSVGMGNGDMGAGGAPRVPISNEPISVCPNGISTEAFARSITESGVDVETLAQETFLTLNWANGVNSGIEAKVIHTWTLFDQHYYFNRDGSITYSN